MAYAINITEKDILDADTYINLEIKEKFVRAIAFICTEPVEIQNDSETLPMMFRENKKIKAQYLMGVVANLLKKPFESVTLPTGEELVGCMCDMDYDKWAESHVMNQLERLKKTKDKAVADKLFDLLYEYKAVESMLTGAIRDEMEIRNDPFNRAMQWLGVSAADAGIKELVSMAIREATKEDADG